MLVRRGLLVMLASSVFFAAMAVAIRFLKGDADSPHINAYMIALVRFAAGNLFVLGAFAGRRARRRWVNWRWIVVRGVMGGVATISYYWSILHLGLAKGVLYGYTYPIFAAVLAVLILGERLSVKHWLAVGVSVAGMGFVTGIARFSIFAGDMIGLSVGVTSAVAIVALTKCRRTDTAINIFWSQCLFGLLFAIGPAIYYWVTPTWSEAGLLLLVAVLSIAGQLSMTSAYRYTGATYGSVLGLLSLLLATGVAVLVFEEQLSLGFWIGAVLILVPCIYLGIRPVARKRTAGARPG